MRQWLARLYLNPNNGTIQPLWFHGARRDSPALTRGADWTLRISVRELTALDWPKFPGLLVAGVWRVWPLGSTGRKLIGGGARVLLPLLFLLPLVFPLPSSSSFFWLFRAAHGAYGSSQARGPIGAATARLDHSHSNTASEPHPKPTSQLAATPDP